MRVVSGVGLDVAGISMQKGLGEKMMYNRDNDNDLKSKRASAEVLRRQVESIFWGQERETCGRIQEVHVTIPRRVGLGKKRHVAE